VSKKIPQVRLSEIRPKNHKKSQKMKVRASVFFFKAPLAQVTETVTWRGHSPTSHAMSLATELQSAVAKRDHQERISWAVRLSSGFGRALCALRCHPSQRGEFGLSYWVIKAGLPGWAFCSEYQNSVLRLRLPYALRRGQSPARGVPASSRSRAWLRPRDPSGAPDGAAQQCRCPVAYIATGAAHTRCQPNTYTL
jgi:hypothetical protein